MGLADPEDASEKIKPSMSAEIDTRLEQSQINIQLRDVSIVYTPIIARSKLNSVNLGSLGLLGSAPLSYHQSDSMLRLNSQVTLNLSHLKLGLEPKLKNINL